MFFLCHCTDTEKKMLLSKLRKASGIGKSIESQTSKRDVSTSTDDLGLFDSISTITLSVLGILHGFSIYICCVFGIN